MKEAILSRVLGVRKGREKEQLMRLRRTWTRKLAASGLSEARHRTMRSCRVYGRRGTSQRAYTCSRHRYCPMCRAREVERILRECQGRDVLYGNFMFFLQAGWERSMANMRRGLEKVPGLILISRGVTAAPEGILATLCVFFEASEEARAALNRLGMGAVELPRDVDAAAAMLTPLHWSPEMRGLSYEEAAEFIAVAKTMRGSAPRKRRVYGGGVEDEELEGVRMFGEHGVSRVRGVPGGHEVGASH